MKAREIKFCAISLTTALAAFAAIAQANGGSKPQTGETYGKQPAQSAVSQGTDCKLGSLMDAHVKSAAGKDLGDVEDLVINPRLDRIDYIVLGRGGFLGIAEKRVPVPWEAVTSASHKQITLNLSKEKLQAAPSMGTDESKLSNPGFLAQVDQYYGVQRSAMGAAQSPGGIQQGHTQKAK
jgi:sporulation protein YlmC with PRC-barrel domain